ncbi:Nn.00g067040.m01.CDS01 [Neocucurbitaria sp. VM-36]
MLVEFTGIQWQVNKTDARGQDYGVLPTTMLREMQPKMITLEIPDQTDWPEDLWVPLDAANSAHMAGRHARQLGIIRYLERALSIWSSRYQNFRNYFLGLPFGSIIQLHTMSTEPVDCTFSVIEGSEWAIGNTATELQSIWGLEAADMPLCISIDELRMVSQLTNSVVLVTIVSNPSRQLVLKVGFSDVGIYHEIKVLLTMAPHQFIEGKPQYLVTLGGDSAAKENVCGILLQYYERGSLEGNLEPWDLSNPHWWTTPLRRSRQICDSLLHVVKHSLFCSDLRLDNILLEKSGDEERCILIDLQMDRNIFSWSPPEMLSTEWIVETAFSRLLSAEQKQEYVELVELFTTSRNLCSLSRQKPGNYDNAAVGWWFPWTWSTLQEREAGMVYLLGKVLWCLFEGEPLIGNILGRSLDRDMQLEFPDFVRTPPQVQQLIKEMTAGSREWSGSRLGLYRRAGVLFPRGRSGINGEPEASFEDTQRAVTEVWQHELTHAKALLRARIRNDQGHASEDDSRYLEHLTRPTLQDVLDRLKEMDLE